MDRPLAPNIYAALHGRDLIVLDLNDGQYDLIAGCGDDLRLSPDRRLIACLSCDLEIALDDLGLFGDKRTAPARLPVRPPARTVLRSPPPKITLSDRAALSAGWSDMLLNYHRRSFAHLISHARRGSVIVGPAVSEVVRHAIVFDRLSVWLPLQSDCLYRCFFLLRRLGRAGEAVDWVFGVRSWPFYAHCWLQLGDVVLTDTPERLLAFSEILVV